MNKAKVLYRQSDGFVQLQTEPFIPSKSFDELLAQLNACYDGEGEPLLSFERFGDGTVAVTGSTVLLQCAADADLGSAATQDEASQVLQDLAIELERLGVAPWIRKIIIANIETGIPLGEFLPALLASEQTVKVRLTDSVNGNSDYDLRT